MPRVFFTGRKKIARNNVSLVLRPGRPPEFSATIDLSKYHRSLPRTAKVIVEAYHNTMLQRFDFGTVADCRPRDVLRLTSFDEWDRPRFRIRVVGIDRDSGVVLASCEGIHAMEPKDRAEGGHSMLKLVAKPDLEMNGELWKLADVGGAYQLWYNKDVPRFSSGIKSKLPDVLGPIIPAALREILARHHLWGGVREDPNEWTSFACWVSGDPFPERTLDEEPSQEDVESWIDGVIAAFCRHRARFVERILAMAEDTDEPSSV